LGVIFKKKKQIDMDNIEQLNCFHDWVIISCRLDSDLTISLSAEIEKNTVQELRVIFQSVDYLQYEIWDEKPTQIFGIKEINDRMRDSWFQRINSQPNDYIAIENIGGSDEFNESGGELKFRSTKYNIMNASDISLSIYDVNILNKKRFI
jgi:hypothetical protein